MAARTLAAAEGLFAARLGSAAAFARAQRLQAGQPLRPGDLPSAYRLRHLPTIRRLVWALERIDRYGELSAGRPGAGLERLAGLIEGHEGSPPRSLAYFLPALEEIGRTNKHQWAPKIKDRRIAEGKRPARRAAARPGRGPALGYDPKTTHFPGSRRRAAAVDRDDDARLRRERNLEYQARWEAAQGESGQ